jgi:hypothetical protein
VVKTPQQRSWDFLAEIGVEERSRSDALRWCKRAKVFTANRHELAGFLRFWSRRVKVKPWNPARMWNVYNADGVERFKWSLSQYRGEKRRKPAADAIGTAPLIAELRRLAREARG